MSSRLMSYDKNNNSCADVDDKTVPVEYTLLHQFMQLVQY